MKVCSGPMFIFFIHEKMGIKSCPSGEKVEVEVEVGFAQRENTCFLVYILPFSFFFLFFSLF